MSDQLLTRRTNFLSYVWFQLFINWVFLVFNIRGSVVTFEVRLFEVLDATLCLLD